MWSDDGDQENTGPMSGKTTEKSPNYEEKKGCSKRSCACFKFGKRCNSSCENKFNYLDYFFSENQKCCANGLHKNAKTADELQKIDRDALIETIMKSGW